MAIFRKSRRARAGGSSSERARPQRPRTPGLPERLAKIALEAKAPEDVFEPALAAFLEVSGARAGALCLFDPRHGVLRLAVESGLSDEGCRRLRTVRRGDPTAWDMPLHGLVNRRAYLIESAAHNRYVPRLIENAGSVRTVACIPLYAGPMPVGSLVLVAVSPRSFGERDVHALEAGLSEMARLIEVARRRAAGESPAANAPRPVAHASAEAAALAAERDQLLVDLAARMTERERFTAELATRSAEAERLGAALDAAVGERTRLTHDLEQARRAVENLNAVSTALAGAEKARARLAEALEASAAERAEQARALATLDAARGAADQAAAAARAELTAARRTASEAAGASATRLAEQATERERLQARVAEIESALERERERARVAERDHDRLLSEARAAAAQERRLREEREALIEQGATAERADLEQAHAATEATRAEAEAARAEATSAGHVIEALEEEATQAHAEIQRLSIALDAARAAQGPVSEQIAELQRREREASERATAHEQELARLRSESDRLAAVARQQDAERAAIAAHGETLAAERDRLRESDSAGRAELDRLQAQATAAEAARAAHEEALVRETVERQRLAAALAQAETTRAALESAEARRDAEGAARITALQQEIERLLAERPTAIAAPAPAEDAAPEPNSAPLDEAAVEPESLHPAMRVVTVGGGPRPIRPREPGEEGRGIVVVDVDPDWEQAVGPERELTVLAPDQDLAARLAEIAPERVLVNLAAPGVLAVLPALRAAGCTARFWACIATPSRSRGLALGTLELAAGPFEPEAVIAALGPHTERGTRVVTAGVDVDALMSLRQALARRGMSVSMAWDAKQAGDLLGVVRPEVVVVDLDLPRRDGFSIVSRLATIDPTPHAVIVGGGEDVANSFASTLADPSLATKLLPLPSLIGAMTTRKEPQPAAATAAATERRPKLRALGLTRK